MHEPMLVRDLATLCADSMEFIVDVGGIDTVFYSARSFEDNMGDAEVTFIAVEPAAYNDGYYLRVDVR